MASRLPEPQGATVAAKADRSDHQLDAARADDSDTGQLAAAAAVKRMSLDGKYQTLLRARFARRTPDYAEDLSRQNDARAELVKQLPLACAFAQQRIDTLVAREDRFTISENELATCVLAEGGDKWLARNQLRADIDPTADPLTVDQTRGAPGLLSLGMAQLEAGSDDPARRESAATTMKEMRPWMPPSIDVAKGADFHYGASLEQLVFGVAAAYAKSKADAAHDYRVVVGRPFVKLGTHDQCFWATLYFNGGSGLGHSLMKARLGDPSAAGWTARFGQSKGHDTLKNPYEHALQRTAALERLDSERPSSR